MTHSGQRPEPAVAPARPVDWDECRSRAYLLLQKGRISQANYDHILEELQKRASREP